MGYGCEGCLVSSRGQQESLAIIRELAKKYATENEKTVAIYKEGFEFFYIEEEKARELNCFIIEIISKHQ